MTPSPHRLSLSPPSCFDYADVTIAPQRTHLSGDFFAILHKDELVETIVEAAGGALCRYREKQRAHHLQRESSCSLLSRKAWLNRLPSYQGRWCRHTS